VELDVGQPLLLPAGAGEVIGDSAERRVEILSDHDALHATWTRFGPHRAGAEPHVHRRHSDLFYVLAGELTVALGADRSETIAPAGTLVLAPPLVVHGFRNGSAAELRYLNFHAPGEGFAGYLRGLRDGQEKPSFDSEDPPADGGRPVAEAIVRRGVTPLIDLEEIGITEVRSGPGSESGSRMTPQHLHLRHNEFFYVLAGELAFTAGGRELRATPGSWVQIPPGVPHTFAVTGSEEVHFLDIHAPSFGLGELDQEPA